MGFYDNFSTMRAAEQAAFGVAITYIPADSRIAPFVATGVFENYTVDQMETHILRDAVQCTITHDDLVAGGLTGPTEQTSGQAGDTITREDINGSNETWNVLKAQPDAELGVWELTLERALRIVP
jgi:hypothetical protein